MATNVKQEAVKREPGQTVLPWRCLHTLVANAEEKQPPAIDLDSTRPRPTRAAAPVLPPRPDQPIRTATRDVSPVRSRSPKGEDDGGAGKFTSAKDRQNAFQAKMRSNRCPIEVKEKWADLSTLDRFDPLRQSFVDEIAEVVGLDFSGGFVRANK